MNAFWMGSVWWSWPAVAAAFAFFPLCFWHLGTAILAAEACREKNCDGDELSKRDIKEINRPLPTSSPSPASRGARILRVIAVCIMPELLLPHQRGARIPRGIAVFLGTTFFLGFELHLWINVLADHVTVGRALLVQLTLFMPFLVFCLVGAYIDSRWYLYRVAQRRKRQGQK